MSVIEEKYSGAKNMIFSYVEVVISILGSSRYYLQKCHFLNNATISNEKNNFEMWEYFSSITDILTLSNLLDLLKKSK